MQHQRRLTKQQQQIFKQASRTYYGATKFFPRTIRKDVYILYAFVRLADDFVDQQPQDAPGLNAFKRYYESLIQDKQQEAPTELSTLHQYSVETFVDLCKRTHIKHEWVMAFFGAMESDVKEQWQPKRTMQDTIQYMYGSAEVIGLMMAQILHIPQEGHQAAMHLGRAMQYANFIRDIKEDQELGRQYLPQEELTKYGLSTLHNSNELTPFIQAQVNQYHQWQTQAEEGFHYLPSACRVAVKTASDMYTWTMECIAKDPERVWKEQIKPTKWQVVKRGMRHTWSERLAIAKWLLNVSRPRFWLYLGGTYLVGATFGASSYQDLLHWKPLVHLAFFLVPANVLLYGINDVFDEDTDQYNSKKDGAKETRVTFATKSRLWAAVLISLIGGFTLFFWETNRLENILLGLFFVLAVGYSAKPLRFKAKPFIDSISNVLYILPGILGYMHTTPNTTIPWLALGAGWCWAASMHLFSAIPDIEADTQANLRTTAIMLGRRWSLVACTVLWSGTLALTAALHAPWWILVLASAYPLIPFVLLLSKTQRLRARVSRVYWIFPYLNGAVGFVLFTTAALQYF